MVHNSDFFVRERNLPIQVSRTDIPLWLIQHVHHMPIEQVLCVFENQ